MHRLEMIASSEVSELASKLESLLYEFNVGHTRITGGEFLGIVVRSYDGLPLAGFQAPDFYRKLGFDEAGRIDDYPRGHAKLWMRKVLG